jgi:hypothetical protein
VTLDLGVGAGAVPSGAAAFGVLEAPFHCWRRFPVAGSGPEAVQPLAGHRVGAATSQPSPMLYHPGLISQRVGFLAERDQGLGERSDGALRDRTYDEDRFIDACSSESREPLRDRLS